MKLTLIVLSLFFSLNSYAASKVLATVNGNEITQAAVENFMSHVKRQITVREALSEMITVEMLTSARLEKPIVKDSTLQLELDRNRKAVIAADMIESMLAEIKMSDEELKAEYDKQYNSADALKEYNANHILVKDKEKAEQLIVELSNGADFEELAKKNSTGPSGKNGGALGWFGVGKMVKPFSDATTTLTKGAFSKTPVKTQFGWHIIKLNDLRDKTPPSLESVADTIKRRYSALKLSETIQKMHKSADIKLNP